MPDTRWTSTAWPSAPRCTVSPGCAIGEVLGVAIGTALGLANGPTIALGIVLAFVFGYSLTSLPLLRAGLALAVVSPIASPGHALDRARWGW